MSSIYKPIQRVVTERFPIENKDFFIKLPRHKAYSIQLVWGDQVGTLDAAVKLQYSNNPDKESVTEGTKQTNWDDHPTFSKVLTGASGSETWESTVPASVNALNINVAKNTLTSGILSIYLTIFS